MGVPTMRDQLEALHGVAKAFIKEHGISCAEAVHQGDSVSEDSLEFIESVCEIVGYDDAEFLAAWDAPADRAVEAE